MKRMALFLSALLLASTLLVPGTPASGQEEVPAETREAAQEAAQEETPAPEDVTGTASYGLGLQMGRNFNFQEFDVDLDLLLQGLRDGLSGAPPRFGREEIQAAIQASQLAAVEAIGARNRALGEAFLAANAKKQGVFTLASGLQYRVLKEGSGPVPTAEDRVVVHYRTTLVDGTEIDNTFQGEPQTHAVDGLIPAWVEALQLMPVGSRWRLFVPPKLAHEDRGSGRIGPGATAIFDIELVEIAGPEEAEPEPAGAEQAGPDG